MNEELLERCLDAYSLDSIIELNGYETVDALRMLVEQCGFNLPEEIVEDYKMERLRMEVFNE